MMMALGVGAGLPTRLDIRMLNIRSHCRPTETVKHQPDAEFEQTHDDITPTQLLRGTTSNAKRTRVSITRYHPMKITGFPTNQGQPKRP